MRAGRTTIASAQAALPLVADEAAPPVGWAEAAVKLRAAVELTKPRLTFLVLCTVAAGYILGARGGSRPDVLVWTVLGAGLVAAGAATWNQLLERDRDLLMRRTEKRPLPSGRIAPVEAGVFGSFLAIAGSLILTLGANPAAALVAVATFLLYICVYTPLKVKTTLNTAVGAIPGALPPVIGWAAATDQLGIEALVLFLIVFLWQFPHFLAIAWIHRSDYARAGYRMLPSRDPEGTLTAGHALLYALVLIPVGILPSGIGLAGPYYFLGALAMGIVYAIAAARFCRKVNERSARRLLYSSFLYLPAVLALLLANPMPDGRGWAAPAEAASFEPAGDADHPSPEVSFGLGS